MVTLQNKISDIMVRDVEHISPHATMSDVANLFDRKHIHHIPVVEDDKLVGLISKSDFLFFRHDANTAEEIELEYHRLASHRVDRLMHTHLKTLTPNHTVQDAVDIFQANYFGAIPIIEGSDLKGIVTPLDVIKFLSNQ